MTRGEIVAGARDAIQAGSKSFRAASRLFDPLTRERSWLLYCWCRHCDDVADGQTFGRGRSEAGDVGQLQRDSHAALAGRPSEELPFQALAQLNSECPIPQSLVDDHLQGFVLDDQGWVPQTEADLIRYCYHVAGAVGGMMAVIFGVSPSDEATLARAADLGIAFQLSNIARDIREDRDNGRCYLPRDWLAEAGIAPEAIFDPAHRPALVEMVARLIALVEAYENSARKGVDQLPFRSQVAVLTALRIYGAIGREVARRGGGAWDQRVAIGKLRKLAFVVPSVAEATFGLEPARP